MIWWWVVGGVASVVVAALSSDDSSSSSSDYDRKIREENERAEKEARERAKQKEEEKEREQAARTLAASKNLAATFLKQHYKNHNSFEVFLSDISQLDTPYAVKLKLKEIVDINICDDIQSLENSVKQKKSKINQINVVLSDLNQIKDYLND